MRRPPKPTPSPYTTLFPSTVILQPLDAQGGGKSCRTKLHRLLHRETCRQRDDPIRRNPCHFAETARMACADKIAGGDDFVPLFEPAVFGSEDSSRQVDAGNQRQNFSQVALDSDHAVLIIDTGVRDFYR